MADTSLPRAAVVRAGVKPHLALVAVQLFFGTWPIVGKLVLEVVPSTGLVAFRVAGGALAFLILRRKAGRLRLERRSDYARVALYSLLGVVLNQLLYVKGLELSTAVNATLLGTMIPVFTLLVAVLLGRESFSARVALGVVVAACGAIYLINPSAADFSGSHTAGNLLLAARSTSSTLQPQTSPARTPPGTSCSSPTASSTAHTSRSRRR